MDFEIVPLPKEKWKGTVVPIRYTTNAYYDLELTETVDAFQARMVKKQFDTPVTHSPEEYDFPDRLYQDHWEKAEAYGFLDPETGELLACVEICPEEWSNRLMVTELWVADRFHRKGFGTRLMNLAKERAKAQGRRAIILETQSCNVRAIAFYRSQGFQLIGFDACCYANNDIARHEVRFNFGFYLNKEEEDPVQIRRATGDEMLVLWGYRDLDLAPPTARFFYQKLSAGKALFWALDRGGELIGELYAFLDLPERDFADGETTAYLCAFRVEREYRGQGYGSRLMAAALAELKDLGFRRVTIGVGCDEPGNQSLYRRFGFTEKIKDCHSDPCGMDEQMRPIWEDAAWWLLRKDL